MFFLVERWVKELEKSGFPDDYSPGKEREHAAIKLAQHKNWRSKKPDNILRNLLHYYGQFGSEGREAAIKLLEKLDPQWKKSPKVQWAIYNLVLNLAFDTQDILYIIDPNWRMHEQTRKAIEVLVEKFENYSPSYESWCNVSSTSPPYLLVCNVISAIAKIGVIAIVKILWLRLNEETSYDALELISGVNYAHLAPEEIEIALPIFIQKYQYSAIDAEYDTDEEDEHMQQDEYHKDLARCAKEAILKIGPRAIPYLQKAFEYDPFPKLQNLIQQIQSNAV